MKTFCSLLVLAALSAMVFGEAAQPREEWHRKLKIEEAARSAELILDVRVEEVTKIKLMMGGKGEDFTLQFRLKPTRIVKGVFARPELILGGSDLGYSVAGQLKFMKAGERRLIFLGRSDVGYRNCNENNPSLDQTFPPIEGDNDPLFQSVATLLAVNAETNRFQRVRMLSAALGKSSGAASEPLLTAMEARAFLAAQIPEAAPAVIRLLADGSPAVRSAAASTLRAILEADYLEQPELRNRAGEALALALESEGPNIEARHAFINACATLGSIQDPALTAKLDFTKPSHSIREGISQVRAVGILKLAPFAGKLFDLSRNLPIDAPYKKDVEVALARLDPARGGAEIARQADAAIAAGLSCVAEIGAAEELPGPDAAALLVHLAGLPLNAHERLAFAEAASQISERVPDERLVAPLAKLLDTADSQTQALIVSALLRIGSLGAAQALQPYLPREQNIGQKLRIAEVLGKHGMREGYAYAIEHVSEPGLTEQAVAALVAMKDPRTVDEAKKIFETSNDARWNRVAIRILGALGVKELTPKFLEIAGDWKNPLAPSALLALADLGEPQALPRIREALNSRSEMIAVAGAQAAARLLKNPDLQADDIRDQLALMLANEGVSNEFERISGLASMVSAARQAAFESLRALKDPRLDQAMARAVSDATLEDSGLLTDIENTLRERKVKLP